MSLITKDEALSVLEPFFPLFRKAVNSAWNSWVTGPTAPRMQHPRVRANIIWNDYFYEMLNEIEQGEHGDIRFAKIPYNQGFVIDGRYFIRFKKGDSNYRSSNYPTQTTLNFHDPDVDLFGGDVRLELLYVLDRDGVGIDKIVLTQRKGQFVAWAIDLSAENVITLPDDVAQTPSNKTQEVAKRVIKARKKAEEKVRKENGRGD